MESGSQWIRRLLDILHTMMIFASDWLWLIERFGQLHVADWIPWQVHPFSPVHCIIITGSNLLLPLAGMDQVTTCEDSSRASSIITHSSRNVTPTDHRCVDCEYLSVKLPASPRTR